MLKLNIGAGNLPQDGFTNHDLVKHRPEIDVSFDLNDELWPVDSDSYDEVEANDVLEHLNNPLQAINEIHRILKTGGIFTAKCCGWKNPNFWVDITHKKAFDVRSMDYLDPTTALGGEYVYYTDKKWKLLMAEEDRNHNPRFRLEKI